MNLIRKGIPKEQYDLIEYGGSEAKANFWVMPAISRLLAEHQSSLTTEPPIPLGTPDPYMP